MSTELKTVKCQGAGRDVMCSSLDEKKLQMTQYAGTDGMCIQLTGLNERGLFQYLQFSKEEALDLAKALVLWCDGKWPVLEPYVCNSCGNTFEEPKNIDYTVSTDIHEDGSKTIKTEPRTVSPCCEAEFEGDELDHDVES